MTYPLPIATLIPVRFEDSRTHGWVDGYKVITPNGNELQPYMRRQEAKAFCTAQGWRYRVETQ